ncbi:CDP-alcohol phosphatidyltransferase family protein [Hydrogenimonas sp.]
MTIYDLKPAFQALLRPAAARLSKAGITPNAVTLAALFLSFAQALAIVLSGAAAWSLLMLPATLFLRMALNAVDGIMAKEFGGASRLGAYLNELCDAASDAALYLAFLAVLGIDPYSVVLFTLGALLSEYAGVLGWALSGTRRYDGPFGKSDRAFFIGLAGLLAGTGILGPQLLSYLFWAGALLTLPTLYNRIKKGLS